MKRTIFLFILFLAACAPVVSVPTAVSTPTLVQPTASPTQTLTPTETPKPQIPPEVEEMFDKAGIVISEMTNATVDNGELHITIDGKEVVADAETLKNFVFQENGVTKELYQFLPVIDNETNNMVLYTYNLETKTWEVKEELPPVKISVDKNNPGSCTYMDVLSGNLARSIREQTIIEFPEDAVNMGWDVSSGATGSTAPIYIEYGSKGVIQLVNICEIKDDFMALPNRSFVINVDILNPDKTIKTLNFFKIDRFELDWFLDVLETGNIGAAKEVPSQNLDLWNHPKYGPLARIYAVQGAREIKRLLDNLQSTGNVSSELEKALIRGEGR